MKHSRSVSEFGTEKDYGGFMAKANGASAKALHKVRLSSGRIRLAELHWYEAHGIGKREFKLKLAFLD